MKRIEVIRAVAEREGLIVCNLGLPSRELYSLGDKPSYFYMLGSMGMASSIGLGLGLSQKKRVFAIDGDGSLLMNLGSLATTARYGPPNYCLIVIDNKCYSSTGNQPTHTANNTDLAAVAVAAGITQVVSVDNLKDFRDCLDSHQDQFLTIIAKTDATSAKVGQVPLLPHFIAKRFRGEVMKE
jgi:sulfopyruvate decarboxylase subunit beta